MNTSIKVKKLREKASLPIYMSSGASGCDVSACLDEPLHIQPLQRLAVPTGLSFEIPEGYEIQVRSRSGLSLKQGLIVVNSPGTIDSDYRGELFILLANLGQRECVIEPNQRIAQLILQKVEKIEWDLSENLETSERGERGLGSTL